MDYARFVELRRASCERFEEALVRAQREPRKVGYDDLEALALHYRQLLHDHALARVRYPGTALARRLERLVLAGTHWLQRDAGDHLPSLGRFVFEAFPRAMGRLTPILAMAVGLFLLATLFGFSLAMIEPALGLTFLSPEAVQELEAGRLWTESIFAVTPGAAASTGIATNNMTVAITAWMGGAAAGLLGIYVLVLNGLMLGSVIAITAHYSMTPHLLEFIAAHGPLEITLILVTAAAGLKIGKALVMADDRPRGERLRQDGRDALVVLLGCLPWILLLGFVEGYLSPSPHLAPATKGILGLTLEGAFVLLAWNPFAGRRDALALDLERSDEGLTP